jgi:hypothetical protein
MNDDVFGACGACGGGFVFVIILILVLNVALLIWVARDAKARGMDNPVMWVLAVIFLSFIGLIIYLTSRPSGNLIECHNCSNKRLERSVTCPHCGAS